MKKILINKESEEITTIGLFENGQMVELYEQDDQDLENNIYCGIIRNILPGLQSAFVDIGERKNAFIHIKDIIPKQSDVTGNKEAKFNQYNIREHLKINMPILVQVKKVCSTSCKYRFCSCFTKDRGQGRKSKIKKSCT